VQPIDMIKTRLQLAGEGSRTGGSFMTVTRDIIKNEGFFSMYNGLSAGLLRQATYTTARMGLFRTISDSMAEPGKTLPFYKKVLAGMFEFLIEPTLSFRQVLAFSRQRKLSCQLAFYFIFSNLIS
jgi:hypothetical protein